jgi:IS5 family transposase
LQAFLFQQAKPAKPIAGEDLTGAFAGEDGPTQLFKPRIDCAVDIRAVKPADLQRMIVDATVQSKAIPHRVHSRLLEIARHTV